MNELKTWGEYMVVYGGLVVASLMIVGYSIYNIINRNEGECGELEKKASEAKPMPEKLISEKR